MRRIGETVLRYWHLLSLDAPTVAALWCWAFGRAAHLPLAGWIPLALALGTWLFYVADRLLDARFASSAELEARHRFHCRHRSLFLTAAVPVAAALVLLVWRMPRSLISSYALLGCASLVYLALVHLPVIANGRALARFPKEFAVALIFAAATALPAWDARLRSPTPSPRHHPLLLLCPLFAALCWLNCAAIDAWEQPRRRTASVLPVDWLAGLLAAASCLSLFALFSHSARWLALAAAASAAMLLALDRARMAAAGRRIAADLALLTPLLLPLATRLIR